MAFPVKWHSTDMGGIPDLGASVAGGLNLVLKTCLTLGFNTQVPTGMTYAAGEITVEFGAAHGYIPFQVIEISGADQAEYNGEFRVKRINDTQIIYDATNGTPIPTATTASAFSCYCPPIDGWAVTYEDAVNHILILERTNAEATEYRMRITNDADKSTSQSYGNWIALVEIISDYVDESTYTVNRTTYWAAAYTYSDIGAEWVLFGDQFLFYWNNKYAQNEGNVSTYVFGDINSVVVDDTGHCIINGCQNNGADMRWNSESYRAHVPWTEWKNTWNKWMMTDHTGQSAIISWQMQGLHTYSANDFSYPNLPTNGFHVYAGPIYCVNSGSIRGTMPGMMQPMHQNDFWHKKIVDELPGLSGVPVLIWNSSYSYQNDYATYKRLCAWRIDDWQRDVLL